MEWKEKSLFELFVT